MYLRVNPKRYVKTGGMFTMEAVALNPGRLVAAAVILSLIHISEGKEGPWYRYYMQIRIFWWR